MEEPNLSMQMECAKQIGTTSKWLKFMGIIMILGMALMILAGLVMLFVGNKFYPIPGAGLAMGLIYLVMGVIYLFPALYLLRAAAAGKAAVAMHDNTKMVEYAHNTKRYWQFCGVLCIICLSLLVLIFIGGIVAGIAVASAI